MAMTAAEKARAFHRGLRLAENGIITPQGVERIAAGAPRPQASAGEPQTIEHSGDPLAAIARKLAENADARTVEKAVTRPLTSLFQEWHKQVRANLEEIAQDDLAATDAANEEALAKAREADERMHATGRWSRDAEAGYPHGMVPGSAANALFDFGREGFLAGEIDADTAVFKAVLLDSADYAVNLAAHQFLSSVAGAAREETSAALAGKTVTAGVFDCNDWSWPLASGDPCEAFVIVQSSAVGGGADVADTAQRLVGYVDTATGLPITLNGGDVNYAVDSGSNRLFKL